MRLAKDQRDGVGTGSNWVDIYKSPIFSRAAFPTMKTCDIHSSKIESIDARVARRYHHVRSQAPLQFISLCRDAPLDILL